MRRKRESSLTFAALDEKFLPRSRIKNRYQKTSWQKKTIICWTCWWTSASPTPRQVAKARAEAQAAGVGVVDLLVANKVIRPADVTQAKAAQFGAEVVHLADMKIEDDVISIVPRHIAKKYRVIPVFKTDGKVAVAIADPSDLNTIDSLTHLLNAEIELRVASEPDIEAALNKYYGGGKKDDGRRRVQGRHPGTDGERRAIESARWTTTARKWRPTRRSSGW